LNQAKEEISHEESTGNWQALSTEAQNTVMEGALAYHALKHEHHDYHHWVTVGKAIVALRSAAAEQAGVSPNSLKHPAYRAAYKQLIAAEKAGELREIDSAPSTHAAWLVNNLANVEAWRITLTTAQRISLNHPTSVWRRHPDGRKAEQAEKALERGGTERRTAAKSVVRELNSAADRLVDATDRIESKVGGAELFDMSPAMIAESARNFIEVFGREDVQRFIAALQAVLAPSPAPEASLDPAFAASVKQAKPRRKRPAASTRVKEKV
jgi:hypothetical protein